MKPLSRDRIVSVAVDLIEREGADAISMRRIAAELDAGVMSLYNHVPNKSALLDAVAERIMAEMAFADDPDGDWTDRVRAQAHAFRDIARHYPRSTMVVVTRQLNSPAGLLPVERALGTLREAGFDDRAAVRIFRMFIAYIVGSLMREVGVTPALMPDRHGEKAIHGLDAAVFPHITALAKPLSEYDGGTEFEFGLELLIRAIAVLPRPTRP